jgi:hypothetical protein
MKIKKRRIHVLHIVMIIRQPAPSLSTKVTVVVVESFYEDTQYPHVPH